LQQGDEGRAIKSVEEDEEERKRRKCRRNAKMTLFELLSIAGRAEEGKSTLVLLMPSSRADLLGLLLSRDITSVLAARK